MMPRLNGFLRAGLCSALLVICGCWTGARTRPQVATPPNADPTGPQPQLAPQEFGPSIPTVPNEFGPPLDGPTLEAPAFPPSTENDDPFSPGFNRKRYTQKIENDYQPNFAGTQPPPVILDGPVAIEKYERKGPKASRIGYVELPPAP
ncbi:MAG: hypothetical protein KDA84_14985 [Planctomycetaceae bacterium]|nr:hypothetical protein [Planctomycetaceae bacterium]